MKPIGRGTPLDPGQLLDLKVLQAFQRGWADLLAHKTAQRVRHWNTHTTSVPQPKMSFTRNRYHLPRSGICCCCTRNSVGAQLRPLSDPVELNPF